MSSGGDGCGELGMVHSPVIPVLRQRQKDHCKFNTSQGQQSYIAGSCPPKQRQHHQHSYIKHPEISKTANTYIDQSEVVFIDRKLLWTNVFFQSRGIGALQENITEVLWHKNRCGSEVT